MVCVCLGSLSLLLSLSVSFSLSLSLSLSWLYPWNMGYKCLKSEEFSSISWCGCIHGSLGPGHPEAGLWMAVPRGLGGLQSRGVVLAVSTMHPGAEFAAAHCNKEAT